jgi:transcriptional regulator with XRE-family HTH domain
MSPSEHIAFSTLAERFGWNLRIARQRAGLTQQDLADRLGIKQSGISLWERGLCVPKPASIARLAKALEIEPSELLRETKGLGG